MAGGVTAPGGLHRPNPTATRVLLASMNAGGGHHALRDSFDAVLQRLDPAHQHVEPVVWTSADHTVNAFYAACVRYVPRFQAHVVAISGQRWAMETAMKLAPHLLREATALLRSQHFDVITTTHALQCIVFSRARQALGLTTPLVTAVPDYGAPARGYYPAYPRLRPDALIVLEESTVEHYRSLGVPENRLHLSGFLTREPFVQVGSRLRSEGRAGVRLALRAEVAESHPGFAGFALDRPTLLFLGGSAWTVKTEPLLEALLADAELHRAANLVVVAGRDAEFEARLRRREGDGLHVFGFVSPPVLAALMGLADVPVLGSLAPATLHELLEVGLGPLLLFHFIPGSERPHVGYIESQRLGIYQPGVQQMLSRIREVLGLAPASEALAQARDGFRERARLLRSRSAERALQLPRFLESMAGRPVSTEPGPRAVAG